MDIEKYICKKGSCWEWNGWYNGSGYGRIQIGGKKYSAHRLVYEQLVAPIPKGFEVDHLCFNRKCVNPKHLEAVTRQENHKRASRRKVENHPNCPKGHPYSGTNLVWKLTHRGKTPFRVCRICFNVANKKWRDKNK